MFRRAFSFFVLSLFVPLSWQVKAQGLCTAGQEALGFSLVPSSGRGLSIAAIRPLSFASRLGLEVGDTVEQANSWLIRDCQSYRRAILDAQREKKALLLLVNRKGRRQALAFEATVWEEPNKKAKAAAASLALLLGEPLPEPLAGRVKSVGEETVQILRELEASVRPPFSLLCKGSASGGRKDFAALGRLVQGEGEKGWLPELRSFWAITGLPETSGAINSGRVGADLAGPKWRPEGLPFPPPALLFGLPGTGLDGPLSLP